MDTGCGIVRGLGHSGASTIFSLIGACLLRIVWVSFVFRAYPTLEVVFLSYPISWILTATAQLTFGIIALKRLIRRTDADKARAAKKAAEAEAEAVVA